MSGMQFADIGGVSLHFRQRGAAPRLVLLHEMGGSLESWDGLIHCLPDDLPVLRYDMRGHGRSEKIRGAFAMRDALGDLLGLLDRVGAREPVVLAGMAVGAAVALHFAVLHPERVAGVVACAPATGVPLERREMVLALAERAEREGMRWLVDGDMLPATWPQALRGNMEVFDNFRGRHLANDPASYAATWRMLVAADFSDIPERITCPALVLAGSLDPARPPAVHAAFAARMSCGRCITLESGHFMAVQTPDLVAEAMAPLLATPG